MGVSRVKRKGVIPASVSRAESSVARAHWRVRAAHSAETAEDYAEAVHEIVESRGECRVSDLTRRFGVSHVTVSRTISRLREAGVLVGGPRRPIGLTAKGRKTAEDAQRRHVLVVAFLRSLGVDEETAQQDAEGIEHHVSPRTLGAMERHLRGVESV